ncbi:MAG: hypothetical protein WDZ62_01060 [Candidatus Pacearchaeota archaeon]
MISKFLSFQFGGFYGGDIGFFLSRLEQLGFFSYVLPFLLIFSLTFGILTRAKIFKENKPINAVLALTVSLLALQFNFVPVFFSEIFPRLGVGLAVILVALILLGLFIPEDEDNKYVGWLFIIGALIVFVVVISQSFAWTIGSDWGYWGWFLYDYWPGIMVVAIVLGFMAWILKSPGNKPELPEYGVPIFRSKK